LDAPDFAEFSKWCTHDCAERYLRYGAACMNCTHLTIQPSSSPARWRPIARFGLAELFGLICHSGVSASSGHYVAYVKASEPSTDMGATVDGTGSEWIRLDDSDVRYVSQRGIHTLLTTEAPNGSSVYLMFYRALGA